MGRPKLYTDEERRERQRQQSAAWRAKNQERIAGYYQAQKDAYKAKAADWKQRNPERTKQLDRVRRDSKREEISASRKAYREQHPELVKTGISAWREKNRERTREYTKQWRAANPERALAADKHKNTMRQRLIGGQVVARFYATEIRSIYRNCPPGHHVDHVVPLKGKTVCGLHIPINLQYLPAFDNMSKGSKFDGSYAP